MCCERVMNDSSEEMSYRLQHGLACELLQNRKPIDLLARYWRAPSDGHQSSAAGTGGGTRPSRHKVTSQRKDPSTISWLESRDSVFLRSVSRHLQSDGQGFTYIP
jgi:hypothetical protein